MSTNPLLSVDYWRDYKGTGFLASKEEPLMK